MDFVADAIDSGAPEFVVTGVARIKRLSEGMVRISKYAQHEDGKVIMFHEVWDYQTWKRAIAPYERAMELIDRLPIPDGGEERMGKH